MVPHFMRALAHLFASRYVWCTWTKVVYHNVLQHKPTTYHVPHALGKARRARANVQDKDNNSKASMQYLVNSEDSEDPRGPQWLP